MSLNKACIKIKEAMDIHKVAYRGCEIVDNNPSVVRIDALDSNNRPFSVRYDEQKCYLLLGRFAVLDKSETSDKFALFAMKECAELTVTKAEGGVTIRHLPNAREVIHGRRR